MNQQAVSTRLMQIASLHEAIGEKQAEIDRLIDELARAGELPRRAIAFANGRFYQLYFDTDLGELLNVTEVTKGDQSCQIKH